MKKIILILALFLGIIFGLNFVKGQVLQTPLPATSTDRFCIQVITPAKNPLTGECKEFPTPCDVPPGWKRVQSCSRIPLPGAPSCPYPTLKVGMKGETVKDLQQFLSQSPEIYPEKLTTGYYGKLTEEAVKRLQKKLGLKPTGVIDEKIAPIIFPCEPLIKVLVPNGGESWKIGKTYKINWEMKKPWRGIEPVPLFPERIFNLSIDLVQEVWCVKAPCLPVVSYHITNVSSEESSYNWTIPSNVKPGKYKVRISLFVPPMIKSIQNQIIKPVPWQKNYYDESDDYFEIKNSEIPQPPPTPSLDQEIQIIIDKLNSLKSQVPEQKQFIIDIIITLLKNLTK